MQHRDTSPNLSPAWKSFAHLSSSRTILSRRGSPPDNAAVSFTSPSLEALARPQRHNRFAQLKSSYEAKGHNKGGSSSPASRQGKSSGLAAAGSNRASSPAHVQPTADLMTLAASPDRSSACPPSPNSRSPPPRLAGLQRRQRASPEHGASSRDSQNQPEPPSPVSSGGQSLPGSPGLDDVWQVRCFEYGGIKHTRIG